MKIFLLKVDQRQCLNYLQKDFLMLNVPKKVEVTELQGACLLQEHL